LPNHPFIQGFSVGIPGPAGSLAETGAKDVRNGRGDNLISISVEMVV
jgi:hypothetical protein